MSRYNDDSYSCQILDNFTNFLQNEKFVDLTLRIDSKSYPCHKLLLIASSSYFEKMFSHSFEENSMSTIELFGVSQSGFDQVYNYIYTGEITLSNENVRDVYDVSDMYLYDKIKERSLSYVYENITCKTCVNYWLFANERNLTDLLNRCKYMIINMFSKVCFLNNNLVSLPYEFFKEIIMVDDLDSKDEVKILDIVCHWLRNHEDISDDKREELLDQVRWGLFDLNDMGSIARNMDVILERYMYWSNCITRHANNDCNLKMLQEKQNLYHFTYRSFKMKAIVGGWRSTSIPQIGTIIDKIRWPFDQKSLISLPTPLCFAAAVNVGNHLIVTGGKSNHVNMTIESCVRAYNIKSNSWHMLESMTSHRWQHVAVSCGDFVIVVGGRDENGQILNSVEKYDIRENKWIPMKPFVKRIAQLKGCCHENEVYVTGGYFNIQVTNSNKNDNDVHGWKNRHIYKYNANEDEWIRVGSFPKKERKFIVSAMCSYENKIYMACLDKLKLIEFDPIENNIQGGIMFPDIPLLDPGDVLLPYYKYV